MNKNYIKVNGIRIYLFTSFEALINFSDREKKSLIAINAHKIMTRDSNFKNFVNKNIGYCDGIGALMVFKRRGFKNLVRLPGCEVWLKIIEKFHNKKSFALIGSTENIITETVLRLKKQYKNINIVKYRNGFFENEKEYRQLSGEIAKLKPDIVFVAMGSPHQENLIIDFSKRHKAIYMGLGGSLDIYSGSNKRAPKIFHLFYLEWLFRWLSEPFKRTKKNIYLLKFLYLIFSGKLDK